MFLMASLAACSNGTDAAHTPAPGTTQPTVASTPATEPASAPAGSETAASEPATEGEVDPSKGGQLMCDEWRAATREQKVETVTVYLKGKGLPAEAADATLATIDIDVYCAGTSHADDPIEPGFEAAG